MKDTFDFVMRLLRRDLFPRVIALVLAVTLFLFALNPVLSHFSR